MYFSAESLKALRSKESEIELIYQHLSSSYNNFNFRNARSREFAMHGLSRRLHTMTRAIKRVFSILPPEQKDIPDKDALSDATINIQSFIFNTFGAIDNIGWIWASETGQKNSKGAPIPDKFVGLGPKNTSIRQTLSVDFQKYLTTLDEWFENQTNYRHALAHRIPPYIPPYIIPESDRIKFEEICKMINTAYLEKRWSDHQILTRERDRMKRFAPVIQHSFYEETNPIRFHPQMIADFLTVQQIAQRMLRELNELREGA